MLDDWNLRLFLTVNAAANADPTVIILAKAVATWGVVPVLAIVAALWVWGQPKRRGALLAVVTVVPIALLLNGIVGWLYFRPRPFMLGIGRTLVQHAAEAGFPSDHATFLWTIGLGLMATAASRAAGWAILAIGLATAWARLYLGVHTPIDMLGSLAVAGAAALLARAIRPAVERNLLAPAEASYLAVLRALRLPVTAFPRARSGERPP